MPPTLPAAVPTGLVFPIDFRTTIVAYFFKIRTPILRFLLYFHVFCTVSSGPDLPLIF